MAVLDLPDFDAYPWRRGWRALDPGRPCYTCGGPPSGKFHDGSPSYSCRHEATYEYNPTIDETPLEIAITLTAKQIERADREFEKIEARRAAQAPRFEHPDRITNRKYAIRAELAVATATGLQWRGTDAEYRRWWREHGNHPPDVGEDIEVRFNRYTGRGQPFLRVWPDDNPGRRYVLVMGGPETFVIMGWCHGEEAMIDDLWEEKGAHTSSLGRAENRAGHYAVPLSMLHSTPLDSERE